MRLAEIADLDISAMTRQEIRPIMVQFGRQMNKRLNNLWNNNSLKPEFNRAAYITKQNEQTGRYYVYRRKAFTATIRDTKGKSLNQLRSEFNNMKRFYNSTTSTVKGAKKYQKDFSGIIESAFPGYSNMNFQQRMQTQSDFWSAIRKYQEENPVFDSADIAEIKYQLEQARSQNEQASLLELIRGIVRDIEYERASFEAEESNSLFLDVTDEEQEEYEEGIFSNM